MSNAIDQRVVEMRFDNAHFEKNVSTTMSTLDKLKQKLNLSGASRGLEDVGAATKKVDMTGLGNGVESLSAKFSALQVMGVTALANITNSAVNAGKRIVSALTIDPIKTGFQEYETQINAVQTILANTQSKGSTIEDVNKALDELNEYADMTIYNFTEMTRNIGTFTAAGVDLNTSVNAIQGIANLAAVSGSTSQQASTAMYQLSQALASGTVKLMDWNSVVNAGMGGQVFQDALKETSRLLGTGADAAIKAKGSFRESLQTGWLTADVLTETLKKFTTSGANEYVAKYTGLSKEAVEASLKEAEAMYGEADAIKYASEALAKKSGKNADEIKDALEFAKTATDAATKVKTFTQLWDVLKEAAQSGWSQTWRIIVGDFEQAKALFTPLADFFTGIINKMSDARNTLLESALGKNFRHIIDDIRGVLDPVKDTIDTVSGALLDYNKLVDEIIAGKWGNAPTRWQDLTAAGYDWAHAQNLVNERLGDSTRHATKFKEATDGISKGTKNAAESTGELTEKQSKLLLELFKMTDAQLKAKGYSDEQIQSLRKLETELDKISKKLGMSMEEFLQNINEIDGRWLIFNGFKNVGQSIVKIFKAIGEAWRDAFPPMQADTLFNIIAGFHKFTTYLKMSDETAENLTRTLKGVFAILDIITTVTGGVFKIGFKIIQQILKAFGYVKVDILSITAIVGDAIVAFRDWFEENDIITKALAKLIEIARQFIEAFLKLPAVQAAIESVTNTFKYWRDLIQDLAKGVSDGTISISDALKTFGKAVSNAFNNNAVVKKIKEWINVFLELPAVRQYLDSFREGFERLKSTIRDSSAFQTIVGCIKEVKKSIEDWLNGMKDVENIPEYIVNGLANGLSKGVSVIWGAALELAKSLWTSFCEYMGIASPSKRMFEAGEYIIQGLVNGIQNGIGWLVDGVKKVASTIIEYLSNINWGAIFAGAISVAMVFVIKKLADAFDVLASPLEGLGDMFVGVGKVLTKAASGIKKVLKGFAHVLNAFAFSISAKALKNIAIALAILVGSVIALTFIDTDKIWKAVGIVATLAAILGVLALVTEGLSILSSKFGTGVIEFGKISVLLLGISGSLLLMAIAVKQIGSLNPDQAKQGFIGLAGVVIAMSAVLAAYGLLVKGKSAMNIDKAGIMMLKMSTAMLLMVLVVKLASKLTLGEMGQGAIAIAGFTVFVLAFAGISRLTGRGIDKIGGMMIKITIALGLMVGVVKLVNTLSLKEMERGGIAMAGFSVFVLGLALIAKAVGPDMPKIGGVMLALSTSMLILIGVMKLAGTLSAEDVVKGGIAITIFSGVMMLLTKTIGRLGPQVPKMAGTLIAMSVAIGILAGVCILLKLIDVNGLTKGIIAIGMLSVMMSMMIMATRGAVECKGNITAMAIAIGVMAASVAALSMVDPTKLAGATIALSVLIGMFALLVKSVGVINGGMGTLIVLTLAVGLLGGLLYLLSGLPVESTLGVAASLSLLLLSMSVAMAVLNAPSFASPMSLVAIGILTLVVGALGGILYLLRDLPVESTLVNAAALSLLLLSLSGCCTILSVVGLLGPAAIIGVASLVALVAAVGGLIIGIGALVDKFPKLEEFLNTGIPILEKIGHALGSFFGNVVSGFAEGLTDCLPGIGTNLSTFMTNLQPFIDGAKTIDETAITGIASLVAMVALVTGASIIENINSFLSGGSAMDTFSTQLNSFADAIVAFSNKVKGNIDEESVMAAANAGKLLAEMQSMVAGTGGVVQWFCGEKNLETFGTQLLAFGEAIVGFSNKVKGGIDEEAVTAAASAGKVMAEMQSSIVPSGGVVQWFTGEKNMEQFGSQLVAFGSAIVQFSEKVKEGINEEAVTAAASAGEVMAKLQEKIPASDGVFQIFTGKQNLQTFGTNIKAFGEAIAEFSETVTGKIDEGAVIAAANAGRVMAELQDAIPENKWFDGKASLKDFGKDMKKFGGYIADYSEEVSGIDSSAMSSSLSSVKKLIQLINSMADMDSSGVSSFKTALKDLKNTKISEFASNASSENVSTAISSVKKLISLVKSTSGLDTRGISSFKTAINDLGKVKLGDFTKVFSESTGKLSSIGTNMINAIAKGMTSKQASLSNQARTIINNVSKIMRSQSSTFGRAGVDLINSVVRGIASGRSKTATAVRTNIASSVNSIRSYYTNFYNAGSYLVSGFAAGISANSFKAAAKARAMANAAEKAAKEALDINSPSKVFRALGYSVPEGFAMGIDKLSKLSTASAQSMATTAVDGVKKSISRLSDLVGSDIDSQPTIRPVLDLSDVRAGVGTIGSMFNLSPSVGVMSNLRSIDSMMNQRNQNGTNADIISELSKLRKDLGNIGGGNTYQINGITYDDGSAISEAIGTLIRATRIEGRV